MAPRSARTLRPSLRHWLCWCCVAERWSRATAATAEDVESLRGWLVGRGARISASLGVASSDLRGTELVTTRNLASGEELAFLPNAQIITAEVAASASPAANAAAKVWQDVSSEGEWQERLAELTSDADRDQVVLAVFVAEQWASGHKSPYAPWLAVVPREFPTVPTLWSEEDLRCLGKSAEAEIIADKRARWRREYETLVHFAPEVASFPFESFVRARVAVETRTHGVAMGTERTAFVPFADLLNHNHSLRALWTSAQASEDPGFKVTAFGDLRAGTPLLASYGHKDHSELFRVYGFADPHAEREATLHVELDRNDPYRGTRLALLIEAGAYRVFTFRGSVVTAPRATSAMSAADFELLLVFVRTATAEPGVLEEVATAAAAAAESAHGATSPTPFGRPLGVDAEVTALRRLERAATAAADAMGAPVGSLAAKAHSPAAKVCHAFRDQRAEVLRGVAAFAAGAASGVAGSGGRADSVAGAVAASLSALYAQHLRVADAPTATTAAGRREL